MKKAAFKLASVLTVVFAVIACAGGGTGGTGGTQRTISGTVRSNSQSLFSNITITLAATQETTRTAADGTFSLKTNSAEKNPVLDFDGDNVSSSLTVLNVPRNTAVVHLDLELTVATRVIQPVQITFVDRDTNTTKPGKARARPKHPSPTPAAIPDEEGEDGPDEAPQMTPEPIQTPEPGETAGPEEPDENEIDKN